MLASQLVSYVSVRWVDTQAYLGQPIGLGFLVLCGGVEHPHCDEGGVARRPGLRETRWAYSHASHEASEVPIL